MILSSRSSSRSSRNRSTVSVGHRLCIVATLVSMALVNHGYPKELYVQVITYFRANLRAVPQQIERHPQLKYKQHTIVSEFEKIIKL